MVGKKASQMLGHHHGAEHGVERRDTRVGTCREVSGPAVRLFHGLAFPSPDNYVGVGRYDGSGQAMVLAYLVAPSGKWPARQPMIEKEVVEQPRVSGETTGLALRPSGEQALEPAERLPGRDSLQVDLGLGAVAVEHESDELVGHGQAARRHG